jgi:hypothetical protein
MKNPLSSEALTQILTIAEQDIMGSSQMISSQSRVNREKYNRIKQNLCHGLTEKSNKQMILEFLRTKCSLDIGEDFVSRVVNLRGRMLHNPISSFKDGSDDLETTVDLEYVNRVTLIKALTDFDPKYQTFISHHTRSRLDLLKWEDF